MAAFSSRNDIRRAYLSLDLSIFCVHDADWVTALWDSNFCPSSEFKNNKELLNFSKKLLQSSRQWREVVMTTRLWKRDSDTTNGKVTGF